jgi:hypothetical protein
MDKLKTFDEHSRDLSPDEQKGLRTAMSNFPHLQKREAQKRDKRLNKSYTEDPDGMYPRDDERYDEPSDKGGWQDGMGKPSWID